MPKKGGDVGSEQHCTSVFRNNTVLMFNRALESGRVWCRCFNDYTIGITPLTDNTFSKFGGVVDSDNAESSFKMFSKVSIHLLDTVKDLIASAHEIDEREASKSIKK